MKRFFVILSAVVFFFSIMSAQQIENRLLKLNEHNATMIADFTEKKVMPKMKKETVKKGKLYYSAPDALAMRYDDPKGDYSVIKDNKFIARRGEKVQKFGMNQEGSRMVVFRNTLLYSMQGNINMVAKENDAKIKATESSTRFLFTLEKKHPQKAGVNTLQLIYDKVDGFLISLKLIEANGNYTEYETTNIQQRQPIPEEVWETK